MEVQDSDYLKTWREKLGVSQKRFAELADISLTTLRQFEIGSHKPQRKTLKKLTELMQGIEAGKFTIDSPGTTRRRRQDSVNEVVAEVPEAIAADTTAPKRRGRPPRVGRVIDEAPVAASRKQMELPDPPLTALPQSQPIQTGIDNGLGVIQLSNLDLELINRVLNMSGKEKLSLLSQLM